MQGELAQVQWVSLHMQGASFPLHPLPPCPNPRRNTLNCRLENGKKLKGKPVVTSNLALAWHTLQLSGIDTRDSTFAKQHGKLFRSAMMREAK